MLNNVPPALHSVGLMPLPQAGKRKILKGKRRAGGGEKSEEMKRVMKEEMIQARFMENWTRAKHPEADNYTDRHDNEETMDVH